MQALVSVIIPIYNQMEYLPRCLASVARQTYRNIEVIMVNDGSSDESQIAMDAFERIDRRFHAITAIAGSRPRATPRSLWRGGSTPCLWTGMIGSKTVTSSIL